MANALASFDRIQNFLLNPSREDQRHGKEKSSVGNVTKTTSSQELQDAQQPLVDLTAAILIGDVTLRPSPTSDPVLTNINFRLETSSITMIAGPIGAGKSTLLKAILGELPFEGNVSVSSKRIAYCAQTPWLLNDSIQQNVCGFSSELAFDEEWYHTVMHACALDEDMGYLPNGDESVVGSRGLTLSGGQRQRLVSLLTHLELRRSSQVNVILGSCESGLFET